MLERTKANKQPGFDLARLKWIDPCSGARFTRKDPVAHLGGSTETLLQNILRLADELFDHLSVFEQFSETTSRGARADPAKKLVIPNVRARLLEAELELSKAYRIVKKRRKSFVARQLKSLGITKRSKGLKVHIGSADQTIRDWVNVDAGGANLTLNVNWGLSLPDGCARLVYCAHLLEHLRYNDRAPIFVREVHRILAKGGVVRFVVPDIRKLLTAYVERDREFFESRQAFYPLSKGFLDKGIANLDYILLFSGAGPQLLNFNHKFGYDSTTLCKLLVDAGFTKASESEFQGSVHPELRVDRSGHNAVATTRNDEHFSLFVEATK